MNDATVSPAQPESTAVSPEGGNPPSTDQSAVSDPTPEQRLEALQKDYANSTREAQRLAQENARYQAYVLGLQAQQAAQPTQPEPEPTPQEDRLAVLAKKLSEAALTGDEATVRAVMEEQNTITREQTLAELQTQQTAQATTNARVQDSVGVIQRLGNSVGSDPALAQAVTTRYQELVNLHSQGSYKPGLIPAEDVYQLSPGQNVNVHLLRDAMEQVVTKSPAPVAPNQTFGHPPVNMESGTSAAAAPNTGDGAAASMLNQGQLETAKAFGMTPEQYFNGLTDDERAKLGA